MSVPGGDHVTELLPAYVGRTLDPRGRRHAELHLRGCAACRAQLASWEAVAEATVASAERMPSPSQHVMEGVWARIERGETAAPVDRPAASETLPGNVSTKVLTRLSLAWQLLRGQLPLVSRGIWTASGLTMAVGLLFALLITDAAASNSVLAILAPVIAAVGVAFVYGPENDPSLEVALSTQTSPRSVLLARLTLVYGYDLALALLATAVLALAGADAGVWGLISLWIGPMLFLSALTLVLSLLFGSAPALLVAMALWGVRLAAATNSGPAEPAWAQTVETLWRANAALLPLAALLLTAALLLAPYRSSLAREQVG